MQMRVYEPGNSDTARPVDHGCAGIIGKNRGARIGAERADDVAVDDDVGSLPALVERIAGHDMRVPDDLHLPALLRGWRPARSPAEGGVPADSLQELLLLTNLANVSRASHVGLRNIVASPKLPTHQREEDRI